MFQKFISSGEKEIIKASLSYDLDTKSYAIIENAKNLLMHKIDDIRILALSYLANTLKKKELSKLLNNYIAGTTYYYNVVCWIDRILFAPPKIKSFYKKEILNMVRTDK